MYKNLCAVRRAIIVMVDVIRSMYKSKVQAVFLER